MSAFRSYLVAPFVVLTLACACTDDDDGVADTAPAAPSGLTAQEVGGGAHLTWTDNADNEDEFMIMRMVEGDNAYDEIATVPFDSMQYHDTSVTAATSYRYMVMAMNAFGESESNEVTFDAP